MALSVTDDPARSRYELRDDGRVVGFTEYRERDDGVLVFPHTVITTPKRGAGYGSTLSEPDAFAFRGLSRSRDGFFVKFSYLFRL